MARTVYRESHFREIDVSRGIIVPLSGPVFLRVPGGRHARPISEATDLRFAELERYDLKGHFLVINTPVDSSDVQLEKVFRKLPIRSTVALAGVPSRGIAVSGGADEVSRWLSRALGRGDSWVVYETALCAPWRNMSAILDAVIGVRRRAEPPLHGSAAMRLEIDLDTEAGAASRTLVLSRCPFTRVMWILLASAAEEGPPSDRHGLVSLPRPVRDEAVLGLVTSKHVVFGGAGQALASDLTECARVLADSRGATDFGCVVSCPRQEDARDLSKIVGRTDRQFGLEASMRDHFARAMFPHGDKREPRDEAEREALCKQVAMAVACEGTRFRGDVFRKCQSLLRLQHGAEFLRSMDLVRERGIGSLDAPEQGRLGDFCDREIRRRLAMRVDARPSSCCYSSRRMGPHEHGVNGVCRRCGYPISGRRDPLRTWGYFAPSRVFVSAPILQSCANRGYRTGICPLSLSQLCSDVVPTRVVVRIPR